jgi:hypothetical protein
MKGQTKNLSGQARDALLALPDTLLRETLAQWLDGVDEQLLDWSTENPAYVPTLLEMMQTIAEHPELPDLVDQEFQNDRHPD